MDLHAALHALGFALHESPSAAQVKKAYYKTVLLKHPDKGGDPDEFVRIQEAMRLLTGANIESDVDDSPEYEAQRLYDDISDSLARGDLLTVNSTLPSFWDHVAKVTSDDQKEKFIKKLGDRLLIHCDAALAQLDSTDDARDFGEQVLAVDLSRICTDYVLWFQNTVSDMVEARVQDIETMRQTEREADMLRRVREACAKAELAQKEAQQVCKDAVMALRARYKEERGRAERARAAAEAKGRELDAAAEAHAASMNQNLRDAEALRAAQEECDRLAAVYQASFEREASDRAAMETIAAEKEQAEAEFAEATRAAVEAQRIAHDARIAANKRAADATGVSQGGKRVKVEVIEILD